MKIRTDRHLPGAAEGPGLCLVVCLLAALLAAGGASAQTTGKIAGRVTDAATGDPLPGVNVLIEGTTQGTATGLDGDYVIIGVRPGVYTVSASFIGFARERKEGVTVNVDLTTTVDFALREEVFEGEEVVVTAEAIKVRKDLTSSEARIGAETIDRLPVQEIGQVLNVQAGITDRNGLHIRGGRASEVVVMVDGVPVTDNFDGSTAFQIENDGIQELQVISGTFNAEFGNAMSGVINIVSKEGNTRRLHGSVDVFSGSYFTGGAEGGKAFLRGTDVQQFARQEIQYRDVDPYGYLGFDPTHYYNLSGSLDGPLLGERLTFFALGRYFKNDGWLFGARIYDLDGTFGDSALVPLNTFEKVSWQGNLRYRLNNKMIVNLISLGSNAESRDDNLFWRWAPDGRPRSFDFGYDTKLKFTHLVSATTFYTIDLATFYRKAESRLFEAFDDPRYNDFLISTPDSVEVLPGVFQQVQTGSGRFGRGGTWPGRFQRSSRAFFAKGDLTSQVSKHHLVKTGFEARMDRLDFESFSLVGATAPDGQLIEPFQPTRPPESSIGFQQFDGVEPITLSAYVQDKIEFENFIVNAGLRVDYFDSRARFPTDTEDPNIFNPFKKINIFRDENGDGVITRDEERDDNRLTIEDREAYWWTRADPKFQISPRLGVAYPITEEGVIHFSYGHFLQIPTLDRMFENFGYKVPNRSGQYGPFGNPDLKAQKTVMYEIGVRQGVGDFVVDVTGYYRDVRNQVQTSPLIQSELPGVSYVIYANRDYANTRGVTFSLNKSFSEGYGFDLNYTFQVVEGSNSDPNEAFFASQGNQQPTLALLPLSWDQRHKVAGSVYVGGGGWGASLLGVWGSGFPYTPSFPEAALAGQDVPPEFPSNSRRQPTTFQVDVTASKTFSFGGFHPRLYVQAFNVFDNRNAVAVFADTGEPDVTLLQRNTGSFDPGFFVRPDFYAEPRRVQLGLEIRF